MYDLLAYKEARIEALLAEIERLSINQEKLTTYIFELCDKDCPEEYRRIVKSEVFS